MASVVTVSEPPCINPFQTVAPRLWRENGGKSTRTRHVIVRVVATPTQPFTFDRILPLLQAEKGKSSPPFTARWQSWSYSVSSV